MSDYGNVGGPYYGGGGSGGGGYLANSPGYGSQESPGGAKKQPSSSLRPVTILQILNAQQAHTDAEFTIDDAEPTQLTFVAQVISCQPQTTTLNLLVTDGTGQIDVKMWLESSEEGEKKRDAIGDMGWVRILGSIRSFHSKKSISAVRIRPITDLNEVYYHQLEALTVHLYFTRGMATANDAASVGAGVPSDYQNDRGGGSNEENKYASLDPVSRSVMNFMANSVPGDDGLHIIAIATGVRKPGIEAGEISSAIDKLLDEGYIYSTIDDEHYAVAI